MSANKFVVEATVQDRTYYEGPCEIYDGERHHARYFSYPTNAGLVVGDCYSVAFTVDRPAKEVWRYLRDLNLWQSEHQNYFSGVLGDLEGKTFRMSDKPNDPGPHYYEMLKVIPEYLMIINQPIPSDGTTAGWPGRPGVSPGFHVFLLQEYEGKSTATVHMEHSALADTQDVQEALKPWRDIVENNAIPKWRKFIPTLRRLVYEGR